MNYSVKAKINLVATAIATAVAVALFIIVADIEGEVTLFFDKYSSDEVKAMICIAWGAAFIAFEQVIYAAVNLTKAENEMNQKSKKEENSFLQNFLQEKGETEKPIDTSEMIECIFCGKLTDKNEPICQHCGRRQD